VVGTTHCAKGLAQGATFATGEGGHGRERMSR
jgi:hypothetical protein